MSKTGKFLLDMRVWSDTDDSTNDPQMNDFKWYEQLTGIDLDRAMASSYAIEATNSLDVQMPVTTGKYVFIKSDQSLAVKFNGETSQNNKVTPTTAGITSDGVLFQKIDFTSLTLENLSADVDANVLIFIGG